jgi:hypothetical protein
MRNEILNDKKNLRESERSNQECSCDVVRYVKLLVHFQVESVSLKQLTGYFDLPIEKNKLFHEVYAK